MEDEQQSREANKVCGVCGDRALGYNFNAVSCESCKAFFRRNALKNKDFRCPFTENCTITQITRRFCQKCRLDKCFSIGMRKEYIMSEEDKVLKRKKIEQNRAKKRPTLETQKLLKMKRESVEDCNFDNDTSVSVTSVASTVSETYFWESDKKYADLHGNRQQLVDNMSPVAAASVPSPSSPPENADIAGSKTLDMLKEPSLRIDTFEISVDENYKGELSLVDRIETEEFDEQWGGRSKCMENCDTLENDPLSVSPKCTVQSERDPMQREPSEDFECEKQFGPKNHNDKRNSEKESQQLPNLVPRLFKNPKALTRILQDENVIMKIMSDPEIIKRLVSDPQVSSILEESSPSREDEPKEVEFQDTARSSGGPLSDRIEPVSNVEDSRVNNPILTNLIIDCSSKECKNQNRVLEDDHLGECSKSTEDVTKDVLQEVQRIPMAGDSIESILSAAIKLEFSAYSSLGGNRNSRELNDAERAKLNELIVANKALLAPLDDDITNLVGEDCPFKGTSGQSDPALLDVINLTAIAIRRIIKMAKRINAFKNMCQDDQLALLKGGCTELLILRAATTYDPDKNMWKIPHTQERMSKIKVDILKEVKGNLYSEHAKFVRTFDPRWRDENIILILSAIALFTPDRPKVVHSDVIKLEQTSYYYLLRRYLESVYPGCEAKSTFLKLIQKISELHRFNHEVVGVYLNVNPSSVEPLLIEIFDLKH